MAGVCAIGVHLVVIRNCVATYNSRSTDVYNLESTNLIDKFTPGLLRNKMIVENLETRPKLATPNPKLAHINE